MIKPLAYILPCLTLLFACSSNNQLKPNELVPLNEKVEVRENWQRRVGAGLSESYRVISPLIIGDTIYVNDYQGKVQAVDRESGKVKWQQELELEMSTGLGGNDRLLFAASLNGDVIALDTDTGEQQWQTNLVSEILSPPQTNGNVVVVQTSDGRLLGLSTESGENLWAYTTNLPVLTLRGTATPQLVGDNLVAGFANGKLAALSAVDGTLYWERRIARPQGRTDIERVVDVDGSPVISGPLIYATSFNGTLSALSPSGDTIWSQAVSSYSSPVIIDGRVIVTTDDGVVKAFDAREGTPLWENGTLGRRKLSSPQDLSGFLMVSDFEGYVHVFDTEIGAIIARLQVDDEGVRSPMVSLDNNLYVLGNDGWLSSLSIYLKDPQTLAQSEESD